MRAFGRAAAAGGERAATGVLPCKSCPPPLLSPARPVGRDLTTSRPQASQGEEHDLELELAKTLYIDDIIAKSGIAQHMGERRQAHARTPVCRA